jgi:hypothetical protein
VIDRPELVRECVEDEALVGEDGGWHIIVG